MPSHTAARARAPRLYCIAAASLARADGWPHLLAHVAGLGFDSLLLTDCAAIVLPVAGTDCDDTVGRLAKACRDAGLRLLFDLELDRLPRTHPLHAQQAAQFYSTAHDPQELPDPRFQHAPDRSDHALLRLDAAGLELAHRYWKQQLAQWLEAGVAGFRCLSLARVAPWLWQTLIADTRAVHPQSVFLAWTPGVPGDRLHDLRDCGFDGAFASDAWWDCRAGWYVEEHQRLAAIAPVLVAPEDPAGPRLLHRLHLDDAASARRAYRRALLSAAATGDGILLCAGFEHASGTVLTELPRDLQWMQQPYCDLSQEVRAVNRELAARKMPHGMLQLASAPHADLALLLRAEPGAREAELIVINADLHHPHALTAPLLRECTSGWACADEPVPTLAAGEVQTLRLHTLRPILLPAGGKAAATRAARNPRIAIEQVTPVVDDGRFPAKRIAGSLIEVEADIFSDGHDKLAAAVLWRAADDKQWRRVPMQHTVNDRWHAVLPLQRIGRHLFAVEAWRDDFASYRDELDKKVRAGLDVSLELQEGRLLVEKTLANQEEEGRQTAALKKLLKQLPKAAKKKNMADEDRVAAIALLLSEDTAQLMRDADLRAFIARSDEYRIDVERRAAEFSSWYELFPRSQSGDVNRHGTFDDVIARIPAVRDMGFDTLYFPPIHPIGSKNKKGKNNTLTPTPDDPGSPYAIGSADGGHDAVHPQLGTLADFRRMQEVAHAHGLEIALDFAIQCSPDHPWLAEHPEWFAWRPDGSIRYAENPPKKYEDIVNVDFYAADAVPDLWLALRDVVLMWVREGVRVFRVDNPHTKPLPFWEWMIGDVRARHPDVIFLSEAFTRPKPMYRLAKVGFSQSYTYFTWRHNKQEFIDYLTELTQGPPRDFFRPHFFVNTPDINPFFLQRSGRPGFLIRAALAATLSGLWGVYSGFELCEAQAVTGKEEYLDSEKYEIRAWDWQRPGNIVHEVGQLNRIRSGNPALHTHLNVRFHDASDEHILYFSKSVRGAAADRFGDNTLLVAINLDPFAAHEATIDLPLWRFGLHDDAEVQVEELMSESRFAWRGRQQRIHLDPQQLPFAIWRVRPAGQAIA
ncbi:maltotransferase domain-containing protein [Oxalicibacterium flavum]|uniref:maltotransferase domain-containing protein n=1 Tax=Oxalicibacterium flavum TaxID=179467 RepID=UPI00166C227C|nr:maltotransferase domain-containing protein [Oxalicibacterium flavum]